MIDQERRAERQSRADADPAGSGRPRRVRSVPALVARRNLGLHLLLLAVAVVVVTTSSTGAYVADFRVEVGWSPWRTLMRLGDAWDSSYGLGRVAGAERTPLPAVFFAVLRGLGLPAWLAQRAWHAGLFFLAGAGAVRFLRCWRPQISVAHVFSGLVYAFGPVALNLIVPSPIFAGYAVAPWMMCAVACGLRGERPGRWAAVFALSLLLVAPGETPSAVFNLAWCLPVAGYVVFILRRARVRSAATWSAAAMLLSAGCLAFALARTVLGSDALGLRLAITETPESIASTTSWSEVFRGMGHWITYFSFGERPRPHLGSLLDAPIVVAATLIVPVVAVAALAMVRDRLRLLLGLMLVWGVVLIVGLNSLVGRSPWGSFVARLFELGAGAEALRTTVKAGAGFALAVAVLFGLGVERLLESRPRITRGVVLSLVAGVLALASWPAVSGQLYSPVSQVEDIPEYWDEAIDWLNDNSTDGVVSIMPGTANARYRWGAFTDDIFHAFLDPDWISGSPFAISEPVTANAILGIDDRSRSATMADLSLAPALARLGVHRVVIRNDLAWRENALPRPATFASIRNDPAFELVASFGARGQNTLDEFESDESLELFLQGIEGSLAPVEVYDLVGQVPRRRVVSGAPTIVAGDGAGLALLVAAPSLEVSAPARYVPHLTDQELTAELLEGANLVVTDTALRRNRRASGLGPVVGANEPVVEAGLLFPGSGNQTVGWQEGVARVRSVAGAGAGAPWFAPMQAFDGETTSGWRTALFDDPTRAEVSLQFDPPAVVGKVGVLVGSRPGPLRVRSVEVEISDGEVAAGAPTFGWVRVDFGGVETDELRIGITGVTGRGFGQVGFNEIEVEGLDLRPARAVPTAIFDRAAADESLGAALAEAPVTWIFEREATAFPSEAEAVLRRRFLVDTTRQVSLEVRLARGGPTPRLGCQPLARLDGQTIRMSRSPQDPNTAVSCSAIELGPGAHLLEPEPGVRLNAAILSPLVVQSEESEAAAVELIELDSSHRRAEIDLTVGGTFVSGISFHPDWDVVVDGIEVATFAADTQLAFAVPAGRHDVELRFAPQGRFDIAMVVSAASLLLCCWLLFRRPNEEEPKT